MSPDFAHPEICGVRSKIRSRSDLSREHERILHDDHLQEIFPMWILSWCFEPSQPRRITSGLTSMDTRPADRGPEETDFCVGRNTLIRSCGSKGLQMVSQEMKCGYPFVGSITSKPIWFGWVNIYRGEQIIWWISDWFPISHKFSSHLF